MSKESMLTALQVRIGVTNWSVLPAPVWVLIACPLLHWAFGCQGAGWFAWPKGCSKSPFRASFWCVSKGGF